MKLITKLAVLGCATAVLTGCGTLTGLPSHGGGKRFAVEQEVVAASSRAAVKELDLSSLVNHKVAIYVSTMGDQGSGTMSGGRYSVDALIRGEYLNNPSSSTSYDYPTSKTVSSTSAGSLSSVTESNALLNAPSHSKTTSEGGMSRQALSIGTNGMGEYRNETLITNPRDVSFLSNLIQTMFYLRGIDVVSPEQADTDVFINVDVFGTIRSRTEMHVYNAESLKAVTKLEYFAIDRRSKQLVIKPTVRSFEAGYKEQYAFWMGPFKVKKTVKPSDPLLVDFSDVRPYKDIQSSENPIWNSPSSNQSSISPAVLRNRSQGE